MNLQSRTTPALRKQSSERHPLLWAALAYGGGLFSGVYTWRPPVWWLIAACVFCVSAVYFVSRRPRAGFVFVLSAVFVLGALTIQVRPAAGSSNADVSSFVAGQEVVLTAHVTKEGNLQRKSVGEVQQTFDVETEQITGETQTVSLHAGVRTTAYSKEVASESEEPAAAPAHLFRYGERIRFPAKLSRPHNFRNPGAFDYRGYLAENGITATASTKADNIELLSGFSGNRAELWRTRIRHSIMEQIRRLWPPEQAALVEAMLIGENAFVGRQLLTDFQRTGTYHVLAISGLKVGILALVTFWLLRRLRVGDLAASAITLLLTIFFAVFTAVGAPVWRATLMLALYLCAKAVYRRKSILNTIGAAGLALLLIDPVALFGASFQLSFLCVLVIAAIGAPVLERTTRPLLSAIKNLDSIAYDFVLPPTLVQFRLDLRMIVSRLQRFIGGRAALLFMESAGRLGLLGCEFLVISLVLQVGFALPMAYYFHRATLVSLPANVLAVPLTQIAMVSSMSALAVSYASLTLAKLPAWIAGVSLQAMAGSVRSLGALRIADARVPTPELLLIVASSATIVLAMVLARRRPLYAWAGLVALAAAAFWLAAVPPHPKIRPGVLEVTSIDVGEGDSILLVSPQGRTLLLDAGGIPHWMHSELDIGEDVVSPYLWSRGIHRLDVVIVSHPHADHIGGMRSVLANFHPRELWVGLGPSNTELDRLLAEAKELTVPVLVHKAGDNFETGRLAFRILAPTVDTDNHARKTNDDSIVMRVSYEQTSVLLEGDAEKQTERRIAMEQPAADLLKIAHHGSATSTIPELLAAVHPQFAVISVGARNVYGHPRREVLDRLGQSHVRTYRTDLDGAVTFYLDGTKVTPQPEALR